MPQRWRSHHSLHHSQKRMVQAKFMAVCFIESKLSFTKVLHCWNRDFLLFCFCSCDLDLDPMTFIYEPDPYSLQIYRIYKYELPTSCFESFHLTDRQTHQNYIPHHKFTCWKMVLLMKIYIKRKTDLVMIFRCRSHRPNPVGYIGQTAGPPSQNVHAGYMISQYSLGYTTITHM